MIYIENLTANSWMYKIFVVRGRKILIQLWWWLDSNCPVLRIYQKCVVIKRGVALSNTRDSILHWGVASSKNRFRGWHPPMRGGILQQQIQGVASSNEEWHPPTADSRSGILKRGVASSKVWECHLLAGVASSNGRGGILKYFEDAILKWQGWHPQILWGCHYHLYIYITIPRNKKTN